MTKRDFFRLIIKIFGLYLLVNLIFNVVPSTVTFFLQSPVTSNLISFVVVIFILATLLVLLLFFPDFMLKILSLDKGFDEDRIDLGNFNNSSILKLAIVVIGGILLIKNIPAFLIDLSLAFKSSINNGNNPNFGGKFDYFHLGINFLNIIIGYLLLANYKSISRFLDHKN